MAKFKNKKTGAIIEETLIHYIDKLRNNPNFEEVDEEKTPTEKEKIQDEEESKEVKE